MIHAVWKKLDEKWFIAVSDKSGADEGDVVLIDTQNDESGRLRLLGAWQGAYGGLVLFAPGKTAQAEALYDDWAHHMDLCVEMAEPTAPRMNKARRLSRAREVPREVPDPDPFNEDPNEEVPF
jgi:hypothetical protein